MAWTAKSILRCIALCACVGLIAALPSAHDFDLHLRGARRFHDPARERSISEEILLRIPTAPTPEQSEEVQLAELDVDDVLASIGQFSAGTMRQFLFAGMGWTAQMMIVMSEIFACQKSFSCDKESIVGTWQLHGGASRWVSTCSTLFLTGLTVGVAVSGRASDTQGRRPVALASSGCTTVFGVLSALAVSPAWFGFTRFFSGLGVGLGLTNSFVLATEFVVKQYRASSGGVVNSLGTLGCFVIAPLAYYLRCWRSFLIAISLFSAYPLVVQHLLLESPKWLLCHGRAPEAEAVLHKLARASGKELGPFKLKRPVQAADSNKVDESVVDGMRCGEFVRRFGAMAVVWFSAGLTYYGLAYQVGAVPGSLYQNQMVAAMVDLASVPIQSTLLAVTGRREALGSLALLCGAGCLGCLFPALNPIGSRAAMLLARLCVGSVYSLAFLYSAELFPTSIRSSSVGICSVLSRCGTLMVPLVATSAAASFRAFSALMCGSAAVALLALPETKGAALPGSLAELAGPRPLRV